MILEPNKPRTRGPFGADDEKEDRQDDQEKKPAADPEKKPAADLKKPWFPRGEKGRRAEFNEKLHAKITKINQMCRKRKRDATDEWKLDNMWRFKAGSEFCFHNLNFLQ